MTLPPEYFDAEATLVTGVTIVYWGAGLLSHAIEDLSAGPSHVQLVEKNGYDGTVGWTSSEVWPIVAESTIDGHKNGVQRNELCGSIQAYPQGSAVAALFLKPEYQARADWSKLTPLVTSMCGKVHYDVWGLFCELLPASLREAWGTERNKFCSAAWATWMIGVGVLEPIVNPNTVTPEQVVAMGIWDHWVPLAGKPNMERFNSL